MKRSTVALAVLATLALVVSACAPRHVPLMVTAEELCKSWRHQTVSKEDKLSQGTAEIADGNNKARPAWGCEPGKDVAKGAAAPTS